MNKEEINTIVNKAIDTLKKYRNGSTISFFELVACDSGDIEMFSVYNQLFLESRKQGILLDESEYVGQFAGSLLVIPFRVFHKKKYMSNEDFEALCDEYDHLFDEIDPFAESNYRKVIKIKSEWKKRRMVFKRDPSLPSKKRLAFPYIEDLDHSPFNKPMPEVIEKKGINIIPLGSGSTGNSFYIEIGGYHLLIDMGIGVRKVKAALEANLRHIEDIDGIFLTHGHSDHVGARKAITNNTHCRVYGEENSFCWMNDIRSEFVGLTMGKEVELFPGLLINCFKVHHDYLNTVGYTFRYNNCKLSYLTDNGIMSEEIYREIEGSDVIIIECNHDYRMLEENKDYPEDLKKRIRSKHGHLSNVDCGKAMIRLHEKGTRNFLLAHLSKHNNTPELALETVRLLMRERYANIYVCPIEGQDLLEY